MEQEKIEQFVVDLLELSGIKQDDESNVISSVLFHIVSANALCDTLSEDDKSLLKHFMKHLQFNFSVRFNLKERKEKPKEKKLPPAPPIKKEKEKEKEEKTPPSAGGILKAALDKKREAFRQECLSFLKKYETEIVTNFYLYWAEETTKGGKMRWETQKTWNTAMRMEKWANNEITASKLAANFRLKKVKQQRQKEQAQQQIATAVAKERQQADLQREAETERAKKEAGGLAEAIANNPSGILAHVMRERQKREANEKQKQ